MKIGRIYKIIHTQSNICYVGSTFNTLRDRWRGHKNDYKCDKNVSIYPYFKEFGIENFKIILIKEYEVVDRLHLESKEQIWINKLNCCNKGNPLNLLKKEKIKEKKEEYTSQNYTCELCNKDMRLDSKTKHNKTKKHLDNI